MIQAAGTADEFDDGLEPPDGLDEDGALAAAAQERADIEARARTMGWKPKEEFRSGPPSHWLDAPEFVARGDEALPLLRDNNKRMSEKLIGQDRVIGDLQNTLAEQKAAIAELRVLAQTANDRGYKRALAELEAAQDAAAEVGDAVAVRQTREQIAALEAERATPAPATPTPTPPAAAPPPAPDIAAFMEANRDWWNVDRQLTQTMINMHAIVIGKHPDWSLKDQLAEALGKLKAEYPDRFAAATPPPPAAADDDDDDEPAPRRAAAVTTPRGQAPAPRAAKSGFDSIGDPTERAQAKAAYERIKRADPDMTVAEYMAVYDDPHIDVLELRRQAAKRK